MMIHAPEGGFEPRTRQRGRYGWGTVYDLILDLELTRRMIEQADLVRLPAMSRALIEGVFHEEARATFVEAKPEWDAVDVDEIGRRIGYDIHAQQLALDFRRCYPGLAERFEAADEERIRTRIGDDRVAVQLDRPVRGWYAPETEAQEIALALRQVRAAKLGADAEPVARWVGDTEEGPAFELGELELVYTRSGWTWQ